MIHYIITTDGAEPIDNNPKSIDYQRHSERQLAPVADSTLHFKGKLRADYTTANGCIWGNF